MYHPAQKPYYLKSVMERIGTFYGPETRQYKHVRFALDRLGAHELGDLDVMLLAAGLRNKAEEARFPQESDGIKRGEYDMVLSEDRRKR